MNVSDDEPVTQRSANVKPWSPHDGIVDEARELLAIRIKRGASRIEYVEDYDLVLATYGEMFALMSDAQVMWFDFGYALADMMNGCRQWAIWGEC